MNRAEWRNRSGRSSKWIRPELRYAIYARDGFDCVYCRGEFPLGTGKGLTLDHVIPRVSGGSHKPDNVVTCCWDCNTSRQDRALTAKEAHRAAVATKKRLDRLAGKFYWARRNDAWIEFSEQVSLPTC